MTKSTGQDFLLKLRFSRLLFALRYWSPIEVELSQYDAIQSGIQRRSITDLDVLGVRYDELLNRQIVVADCKTGRNVSDINRLFWLLGIKQYFGADEAYFIRPIMSYHAKAIAPKIGVQVLTEPDLLNMEKGLRVDQFGLPLADPTLRNQIISLWGLSLSKGQKPTADELDLKGVYSYLTYSFWYIEPHRNLLTLIGQFEKIAPLLKASDPRHVLLAYVGAERFAYTLLDVASHIQAQGGGEIKRYARIYLYGGPLGLKDKEQLFQLMSKLTGHHEPLDHPALDNIFELIGRLMRNREGAADVLRYLSAIYLWCVHLKNSSAPILTSGAVNTAALVLAKDVASEFSKATGIDASIYNAMSGL